MKALVTLLALGFAFWLGSTYTLRLEPKAQEACRAAPAKAPTSARAPAKPKARRDDPGY